MQLDRSYQLNKKILDLFTTGSAELGINLSGIQIQKFSKFVFYLRKWNKIHNLTAISDSQEIITNHLLDSLSVNKYLSGEKIIDVGTGPGFPGLPLALIFPKKAFVLLDSSQKKTIFLNQIKTHLSVKNVRIIKARVENYQTEDKFDHIISRAFSSVEKMVNFTQHLLRDNGSFLAMKGHISESELSQLPKQYKVINKHKVIVPMLNKNRHILEIKFKK